ncbi:MAG: hypothetical protein KC448_07850 [Yoonia sp.]|nr:hypothetical protein [Yoonia sp.]
MAKSDDSALADLMTLTQQVVTLNPMLRPQVEQYWQAQEKMLKEAETFTKHWFERRHTAAKSALETARDVTNGGSASPDAMRVLSDWQRQSLERAVVDSQEWIDLCTRCVEHVTTAEVEAEKAGLEKATKQLASGSKKKHATPV